MKILGISAFYHDSAAALIVDGQILAAVQEERFTRKKHDPGFPKEAVKYCLDYSGISIKELRVDGGATVNNTLMQFQADVLNTETVRPKVVETTAMGAAFLAGLAVGYWESAEEIQEIWQTDKSYHPTTERDAIEKEIKGWYKAIDALEYWTKLN